MYDKGPAAPRGLYFYRKMLYYHCEVLSAEMKDVPNGGEMVSHMGKRTSRTKRSAKDGNRQAVITVSIVVLAMAVAVGVKAHSLDKKQQYYLERQQVLEEQIAAESERAESLEQYRIYVQTNKYTEKIAKEKLGLVNPDEILLKPEQ